MRKLFAFLLLGLLLWPQTGDAAAKVLQNALSISNLWNAYAPSVVMHKNVNRMFFGGWLKQADEGSDIIYYSQQASTGTWSVPVKTFVKKDWAVNDPSVIQHPVNADWLLMYYTALHKSHQTAKDMTFKNVIGWATSVNGGKTWTDHGIVINQNNGFNQHGAWAPTVVLSPDKKEFWVYYHTNSPSNIILRTRLNLNGWQQIGKTEQVKFTGEGLQHGRVNIDIARSGSKLYMVTNEFALNKIGLYMSTDGLSFKKTTAGNPAIDGGPNFVLTPNIVVKSAAKAEVYFGFANSSNSCSLSWQQRGVQDMKCGDSIHNWMIELPAQ